MPQRAVPQLVQHFVFDWPVITSERETILKAGRFAAVTAFLCGFLLLLSGGTAVAAPADLDRSFGGDGIVDVEGPSGAIFPSDASARIAIGPKDEVFVLYSNYAPCEPPFECAVDLGLARFSSTGKRDPSFGVGPGSQLQVKEFTERKAFDLAVGPDGKPVVVASDQTVGGVTVARFDSTGHLDGTFGAGGKAAQPVNLAPDTPVSVAVQPDGKIVVAGEGSLVEGGQELRLARYLPNGEFDPSFGSGGQVVVVEPTKTRPADMLLGPNGSITVAGPLCCAGGTPLFGEGFSLARLLANGQPDAGLAGSGRLFFPTPGAQGGVEAAVLAPDGGIFVIFEEGTETVSTVGNVVKLLPDGTADPAFGGDGRLRLFTRVGGVDPMGLTLDGKGRLVGVGWGDGKVAAFRLRPDGSTDRTFNGGQFVSVRYGGIALAVALQSSGRIVVLGNSGCCRSKGFALIGLRGGTDHTRCLKRKATIVGTNGPDELIGTPRRDVIAALGGEDKVRGLTGPDLICGGKGLDKLFGGPGHNEIRP